MDWAWWVGMVATLIAAVIAYVVFRRGDYQLTRALRRNPTRTLMIWAGLLIVLSAINVLYERYPPAMFTGGAALIVLLVTWYRRTAS